MKCPNCNKDLIWGGTDTYEDVGLQGEGQVSNYSCPNKECEVEEVKIYIKIDNE
tara:strand:+ start:40 stop:201 length:162 start_codon:yes stop_codon:yes gene_type:complete